MTMQNMNCMNVCLGNGLLTTIDKYAEKVGLPRNEAIQILIGIAEREYERQKTVRKSRIEYIDREEYLVVVVD